MHGTARRGRSGLFVAFTGTAVLAVVSCGLDVVGTASEAPDAAASAANVDASANRPEAAAQSSVPTSCAALLSQDSSRLGQSGFYDIDPDGPGPNPAIHVYCEMSIDRGGWTLVGRSAPEAKQVPFGWRSASGSVTDLTKPYSMDVVSSKLAFSEVMAAERDLASSGVGKRAFKFPVASDFLSAHPNDTVKTDVVTTLLGDCSPPGGPTMMKYAGVTEATDTFFLRDIPDLGQHRGLHPDAWDLAYPECDKGGALDGAQGLLFVR